MSIYSKKKDLHELYTVYVLYLYRYKNYAKCKLIHYEHYNNILTIRTKWLYNYYILVQHNVFTQ